ncbi:hypothetical protein NEOKW01_0590 [Nematocida sp. AWRm80]|nr:hypothetical protein NEOKW01_0590 [Nematocida sp. AWRm80]
MGNSFSQQGSSGVIFHSQYETSNQEGSKNYIAKGINVAIVAAIVASCVLLLFIGNLAIYLTIPLFILILSLVRLIMINFNKEWKDSWVHYIYTAFGVALIVLLAIYGLDIWFRALPSTPNLLIKQVLYSVGAGLAALFLTSTFSRTIIEIDEYTDRKFFMGRHAIKYASYTLAVICALTIPVGFLIGGAAVAQIGLGACMNLLAATFLFIGLSLSHRPLPPVSADDEAIPTFDSFTAKFKYYCNRVPLVSIIISTVVVLSIIAGILIVMHYYLLDKCLPIDLGPKLNWIPTIFGGNVHYPYIDPTNNEFKSVGELIFNWFSNICHNVSGHISDLPV